MRALLLALTLVYAAPGPAPVPPPAAAGTLVVLDKAGAVAQLVSLGSGKVVASLPTGRGPHEVAVSPDGKVAVVTNYGHQVPGSTLTVLDLEARRVSGTIQLEARSRPHGIVFLPGGRTVAVTAETLRAVLVVDLASGTVVRRLPTGKEGTHMVALSPDGRRLYAASAGSGSITVLDLADGRVVGHVATAPGAEGLDVSPDGREVWVANNRSHTLTVVDAASLEVKRNVACPKFPLRVKFAVDGGTVLVSGTQSGEVVLLDPGDRTVRKRLPVAEAPGQENPAPIGLLVHPAGRFAYVALNEAGRIAVLDLEADRVAGHLVVGGQPDGLGWTPLSGGA